MRLALACLLFVALFSQGCESAAVKAKKPRSLVRSLSAPAIPKKPSLIRSLSAPAILTKQPDSKCQLFDVIEKCIAAGKTNVYISMGAMGDNTKAEPEDYHTDPTIIAQTRGSVVNPLPNCIVYSGVVYPKTEASLMEYCNSNHYKCFHEGVDISSETLKKCCGKTLSAPVTVVFGDFTFGDTSLLYPALIKYVTQARNVIQGYTHGFASDDTGFSKRVWKYDGKVGTRDAPPDVRPGAFNPALPVCRILADDDESDATPILVTLRGLDGQDEDIPNMRMNTPTRELLDYIENYGVRPKTLLFGGRNMVVEKTLGGNGLKPGKNLIIALP